MVYEEIRWLGDDITFCAAKCKTKCARQPSMRRNKDIPYSVSDFSEKCGAYKPAGSKKEKRQ